MALDVKNNALRTMTRIRRLFGISSSSEISDSRKAQHEGVYYGMFSADELRHMDGVYQNYEARGSKQLTEESISSRLMEVSSNTRKQIDELKNLKLLAPEIEQAKSIIISSILSPTELQTDSVTIKVDNPAFTPALNNKLSEHLTNYFNDHYHLASKLSDWLGCAGFEEGAKPIIVLPRHQLDVLNVVGDKWDPDTLKTYQEARAKAIASNEALLPLGTSVPEDPSGKIADDVQSIIDVIQANLECEKIGKGLTSVEAWEDVVKKEFEGDTSKHTQLSAAELARTLVSSSFKLMRTSERGDCITVTRDFSLLNKLECNNNAAIKELEEEAAKQITGFKPGDDSNRAPSLPVFMISDEIKTTDNDMPIVIELPSDSVIPVCAPGDHKNHIGYYVMLDENGQPIRGQYTFNVGITQDANQRLATNAAKAVFGSSTMASYLAAGKNDGQTLDQLTQVFAVAVNHLLENKLDKLGLKGLDINVHEAVGKALFFNLLAKNKIKLLFVPAPMMVYYRFLHREDGTGKTFLEDMAYILALRCTLTVAKMMAAIDNATKHRRIEVQVDEKNHNPLETLQLVRHEWMAKKVPQITTDPTTAAEGIINSHLSIIPKGLVGNTDNLEITTDQSYGNSQAPDNDLMDTLNNWVCMGLKLPPSALNQLSEHEYAKSVATSNLFFSNAVRNWQNIVNPFNKKFVINYISCHDTLLQEIRKIITDEKNGTIATTKDGKKTNPDHPSETASQDVENDQQLEESMKRALASLEVVLPKPNMVTTKVHFEEITAQCEAVDKIIDKLFPDDLIGDDALKSYMASLRALIASDALREFLPTVGFHQISGIPKLEEVDTDVPTRTLQFVRNFKQRMDNVSKMQSGAIGTGEESTPSSSTSSEPSDGEGDLGLGEFKI